MRAMASADPVNVVISERQAIRIFLTNVDKQDIRCQDVTAQGEESYYQEKPDRQRRPYHFGKGGLMVMMLNI